MKNIIVGLVALATAFVPAFAQSAPCCGSSSGSMAADSAKTVRSFAIQLPTTSGETYDLGAVVGSSPVVITCLGEVQASIDSTARIVSAAAAEHPDVVFLGELCDTSPRMLKHVNGLKLSFPVLLDPQGRALTICQQSEGTPAALFLNAAGEVAYTATEVSSETFSQGLASVSGESELTDPVCGMQVSKASAAGQYEYKGKTYYFCSQNCLKLFRQNPLKYLKS